MNDERRARTLDERTDRLARRLYLFQPDRDTYRWARLRVDVAMHDVGRQVRLSIIPAVNRLADSARTAEAQIRAFGDAVRGQRP